MTAQRDHLAEVTEAAQRVASAREQLHRTIRRATKKHSLRDVAKAAGVSHEQVRRIANG